MRRVAAVALSAGLAAALQAAAAMQAPAAFSVPPAVVLPALAPLGLPLLASAPPASAAPQPVPAPPAPQAGAADAAARASDTAQSPPAAAGDAAPAPAPAPVSVEVTRGWLDNGRGDRLRTVLSRPRKAAGKLPALLLVGWLSCDSVAPAKSAETDIVLLDELAARFVEVPQMDHLFGRHGSAEAAFRKMGQGELAGDVLELILGWLRAWEKAAGGA